MIIAAEYSFNGGDAIKKKYTHLLQEVVEVIASVDAAQCRTKESREITMPGKMLFSPKALNDSFAEGFESKGLEERTGEMRLSNRLLSPRIFTETNKPNGIPRNGLFERRSWA